MSPSLSVANEAVQTAEVVTGVFATEIDIDDFKIVANRVCLGVMIRAKALVHRRDDRSCSAEKLGWFNHGV